jgi:hypothetical protein
MKLKSLNTTSKILIVVVFFSTGCSPQWEINNPYDSVNWANDGQYKANFHTHTTISDGRLNPQTVVDIYDSLGYSILAITDHNSVTWPWTDFSKLNASERSRERMETHSEAMPENLSFQDRNPEELGMIAIQANELSRHHHMGSFFNDHNEAPYGTSVPNSMTEKESLEVLASKNGIAMLYHPGRYDRGIDWYTELYLEYDHLFGLEIYNQGDRYPGDRDTWDSILSVTMPERPIWGYSNDDMHTPGNIGCNWNMLVLPELTHEWVRKGMEKGLSYYVYAPSGHEGASPPAIHSIKVNSRKGIIQIESTGAESVQWISNGTVISEGSTINLNYLDGFGNYVRAVLHGSEDSVTGTQPFGIIHRK